MNRLQSAEEVPANLFHAATIRDKEAAAKQHHVEMIKEGQINIFEVCKQEAKTDMQEQAIKKLRDEMATNSKNEYVQLVGAFLINLVEDDPSAAEKILTKDKTVVGSLAEMKKEASKKKQGNMAMLTPQEGFQIVSKYFSIKVSAASIVAIAMQTMAPQLKTAKQPIRQVQPEAQPEPAPKNKRFNVSLDELI